jgi:hypothetical protein
MKVNLKKIATIFTIISGIIAILLFLFPKNHTAEDNDLIDNKYASNPYTEINITNNNDSTIYSEPNKELKEIIEKNLNLVIKKHNQSPKISIEVESGNSLRHKIALDFESILQKNNLGFYGKGNTFLGRFPDYPITVFCKNTEFCKDIVNSIKPYIKGEFHFDYFNDYEDNYIKFYFNGTPYFEANGSIYFQ